MAQLIWRGLVAGLMASSLFLGMILPGLARASEWDSARNALTAQMQLWSDDQVKTAAVRRKACALALTSESLPRAELYAFGDVLRALPDFFETRFQGLDRDPLPPTVAAPLLRESVFEERLDDLLRRPWLDDAEREAIEIVLARSHGTEVSALRWLIDSHIAVMRVGDRQFRERSGYWLEAATRARKAGAWFWEVAPYDCRAQQIRFDRNAQWLRWGARMLALYRMLDRASDREWDGDWGSFPR